MINGERIELDGEPIFFIMATMVCPLGFLAGIIGTIIILIRKRKRVGCLILLCLFLSLFHTITLSDSVSLRR